MSVATVDDLVDVRKVHNAQSGVYQVGDRWDPHNRGDVIFLERAVDGQLLAFLVAGLEPHPLDGRPEPEMKVWYTNPETPALERGRALWAVALEMGEYFRALGHRRTFGRTRCSGALAAEGQHDGFTLVQGDRGESYVIADDKDATMAFVRDHSTTT